jgi:hypothetical protein
LRQEKRKKRRKGTWKGSRKRMIRRNMKRRKIKLDGRRIRKEVEEEEEADGDVCCFMASPIR